MIDLHKQRGPMMFRSSPARITHHLNMQEVA